VYQEDERASKSEPRDDIELRLSMDRIVRDSTGSAVHFQQVLSRRRRSQLVGTELVEEQRKGVRGPEYVAVLPTVVCVVPIDGTSASLWRFFTLALSIMANSLSVTAKILALVEAAIKLVDSATPVNQTLPAHWDAAVGLKDLGEDLKGLGKQMLQINTKLGGLTKETKDRRFKKLLLE
jgi:hypothetical protein